jgi:hypothetical protein
MVLLKMLCRIPIDEEQVVGYLFGAYSKSTRMRRSRCRTDPSPWALLITEASATIGRSWCCCVSRAARRERHRPAQLNEFALLGDLRARGSDEAGDAR